MRLGISAAFPHSSPEEWVKLHSEAGLRAVVFPLTWEAPASSIDAYAQAAKAYDLMIAEVVHGAIPWTRTPLKEKLHV